MKTSGVLLTVLAVLLVSGCGDRSQQSRAVKRQIEILARGEADDRAKAAAELGRMHASNAWQQLVVATGDLRPEVRLAAVEALVEIGDPRAADVLCEQLKSPAWRNRQLAAQGLGRLRSPSAVAPLRESVHDEHVAVATAAAEALVACGGLADLNAIAGSANEPVGAREAALLILGESGRDGLDGILAAMRDTNSAVRIAAYAVVAKACTAKETPLLVDGLLDPAPGVRKVAQKAILAMDPRVVSPALVATIETGSVERQTAVLKMLESDRTARGVGVLAAALVSERATIRASAERVLAERRQQLVRTKKDPRMLPVEVFLRALSGTNAEVRAAAMLHIEQDAVIDRSSEPQLLAALKDGSPTVRLAAVRILADLAPEGIDQSLTPLLDDADVGVKRAAAMQLAARTNAVAVAIVVEALDQKLREYAKNATNQAGGNIARSIPPLIEALRRSRSASAVPSMLRCLDSGDEEMTIPSLRALGAIGDRSVYDKVTPFLRRTGWGEQGVRSAAIETMAALDPVRAADTLVPILAAKEKWQPESGVVTLCRVLAKIKEPRAADPMIDRLFEHYANTSGRMDEVKLAAVAGLVELGQHAVPTIVRRLNETRVREGALAMILGKIGEPAVKPVIEALKSEDALIRKNAAWALGYMKSRPEMAVPLVALLTDKEQAVRAASAWSLGQLQAKQALPGLVSMVASEQTKDRLAAAEALGRIGDPSVAPALMARLQDQEADVRFAVVAALGALGDKAAAEPLRRVSKEDKEERVRFAATEALTALGVTTAAPPRVK